ncbi:MULTISPECIES: hypothetical protein [unclassified Yoonia]|uniref:hypothetical protein n=1 Tax=unclassified Yoonia TaxID=2629118 RepID=UPI002AFF3EC3|nr:MULTISPECIES: hypothetical protein [unclassified Yoonia]
MENTKLKMIIATMGTGAIGKTVMIKPNYSEMIESAIRYKESTPENLITAALHKRPLDGVKRSSVSAGALMSRSF